LNLSPSTQQILQLGEDRRYPPRLVLGEQLGGRAASRLPLEIDVSERLPVGVADDEAGVVHLVERPRRREAAAQDGIVQWNLILLFQRLKGGDHAYTLRSADVVLRAFDRHRGFTGNRM
jgi:hypothetical protein